MHIKSVLVKNFKCFGENSELLEFKLPDGEKPGSGLNIFVGENNSGKSTLFEAIDFLRNALPKGKSVDDFKNKNTGKAPHIEIIFTGAIEKMIENFTDKKFQKYIAEDNGKKILKVGRSGDSFTIKQGGKPVEMTYKKIGIWNADAGQFENPSGIDKAFTNLFEIDFIWADTNPSDEAKFGSTTICGKILKEISKSFANDEDYKKFQNSFKNVFNKEDSALKQHLKKIETRTQEIFESQFCAAKIIFHFDELTVDSFFKNTKIKVHDGVETYLEDKGSGMQRSIALALLQVYAESLITHPEKHINKPFYLFIDEPEVCLHPQAQNKLLKALKEISKVQQVFISTHSPYFIDPSLVSNIFKFENKVKEGVEIFYLSESNGIGKKEEDVLDIAVREIFFADKVLCVEGKTDFSRFPKFFDNIKQGIEGWTVVKMKGKGELKKYKNILDCYCKMHKIILDLDAISAQKNNKSGMKCDILKIYPEIEKDIIKLGKGKREDLKDEKLTADELKLKNEILEKLKQKNIFVLRYGEIENYVDKDGNIVSEGQEEKRKELINIFHIN